MSEPEKPYADLLRGWIRQIKLQIAWTAPGSIGREELEDELEAYEDELKAELRRSPADGWNVGAIAPMDRS